ncbi:MAG: hypothetical protein AAGJ87_02030 [Pseudomonadota bacterium]
MAETLIAAAIAAGVVASVSSVLVSTVKLVGASEVKAELLLDARNISARLRANEDLAAITRTYPNWTIESRTGADKDGDLPHLGSRPVIFEVSNADDPSIAFEIVTIRQ